MNTDPTCDFIAERNHSVRPSPVASKTTAPRPVSLAAKCGSGWYHDQAIQEAQQAPSRKH